MTKPKNRAIPIAIVCSVLLVLPACGIPDLRHADPGAPIPPDSAGASMENSSQVPIEEFYRDPLLTSLIHQSLAGNQELKIMSEEVAIAANEVLARSGAYLPFLSAGGATGLTRLSQFTQEGAGLRDDPYLPGRFFPNPFGNFGTGFNLTWQLDIYRQLRNARDAAMQRYIAASERRSYFVTTLVAEIADNYYGLMALDKRLENLNNIIALQENSLRIARAKKEGARGTELAVQRFLAEVRKNHSEKLIVHQDIVVAENRINFLLGRYPQPVPRNTGEFINLNMHPLSLGVPSQLLTFRPDIRQAERNLAAAGLDVKVARVNFFPQLVISGGVGLQSLLIEHLFEPQAVLGDVAAGLVGPFINKRAIRAQYLSANASQLQTVYNYQRVIINAFTEVVNRVSMVENYRKSVDIKKLQVESLVASVDSATKLYEFAFPDVDYLDVLIAQRDLWEARRVLIDTKREQLTAIVNTYQALGGGGYLAPMPNPLPPPNNHKKLFRHFKTSEPAASGPQLFSTTDPPAVTGSLPSPAQGAAGGTGPTPPPSRDPELGPDLPPIPDLENGPVPLPTPDAEKVPEPIPTPIREEKGTGNVPKTGNPPV